MAGSRRGLLLLGLVLVGGPFLVQRVAPLLAREPEPEFEPVAGLPGFRRLRAGATSGAGFDPLVGLGGLGAPEAPDPARAAAAATVRADPCGALFGGWPDAGGAVPIASFSDYNCAICRVTTRRLAGLEAVRAGAARITWHEVPILGETSVLAARAALAADRQGAYAAFHDRLMRSPFQPTRAYMDALADDLGLDRDRLVADMAGPQVARRIAESLALRDLLAFPGTPALVVGRTLVEGDASAATLARLIAREADEGPPPACAA
jgi:protein-disulfide isomerase